LLLGKYYTFSTYELSALVQLVGMLLQNTMFVNE